MKNIKRIISLILALVLGASVCFCGNVSAAEKNSAPENFEEYRQMLTDDGYPAISTAQFLEIAGAFNDVYRFLTGRWLFEKEYMNFVADDVLGDVLGYIADETGVDILLGLNSLPKTNQGIEFAVKTFNIDTAALREKIYKIRFDLDAKDMGPLASIMYYLGVYLSVIEECKVYCEPCEDWGADWYEIHLQITVLDGTVEDIGAGIMINPVTGEVRGKNDDGMMGMGYNYSIYESLVYSPVHVWMRDFGFCLFYDVFSYTTPFFFYDTRRIKFDYAGKEWMIQAWKGNYLVSNGAEIGVYNRAPEKFGSYYDCAGDEDMLNMSMKLYHGDDLIFERPEQPHWWLTGFKLSKTLYPANELTLDFTVKMKDEEMLKAFCKAIDSHYRNDMEYTVDGLTVNVVW
ncbi:MAG: DUF4474 domain-containing protein [Clostridia bacterium]|nr:DUF4474 domain-containing protein [Clostridia bacterium]